MRKMKDKRVLVTGSGTGIGREIGLEFVRQGANVAFHYSHSCDGALSAVQEARKLGAKAEVFQADFSKIEDVNRLAKETIDFLGGMDVLVNNAGISFNMPFRKVTVEQFDKLYYVNVRAQFFLTQSVIPAMLNSGGGAICNLTSIHGLQGAPEHSVYAGTKGAIIAYTRALAIELAHKGIRVNAIAPGCIPVANYHNAIPDYNDDNFQKAVKDRIPLGRAGKPVDIAKLAVFLCSDEAEFIVGQTIAADGGTTAMMSLITNFRDESSLHFGKGYISGL